MPDHPAARQSLRFACGLAAVAAILAPLGCNANLFARPDFRSNYAPDRARAAVVAAERGDTGAVPALVNLLEDRDPTVRMYGQLALERLCGGTLGYRYYESVPERQAAVARWREAIREGSLSASLASETRGGEPPTHEVKPGEAVP